MGLFLALIVGSASAWIAVLLLATTIGLPYALRKESLGETLGLVQPGPLLVRLRPHYWLGYAIAGLAALHAVLAAGSGLVWRVNLVGIVLGIVALAAVAVQVILGRRLAGPRPSRRRLLQRGHFWTMAGLVGLTVAHLALDGPTPRGLLGLP